MPARRSKTEARRPAGSAEPGDGTDDGLVPRGLFWLLVAGLAWVPFWLGSNRPLPWAVNLVLFPALVLVCELRLLLRRKRRPVPASRIAVPVLTTAAVVGWVCVQMASWTPAGWHHPLWALTGETLRTVPRGAISVDTEQSWLALLRLIPVLATFWLSLQLCRDPARARQLLMSLAVIAGLYALWGLVAFIAMPETVLWFPKEAYRSSVTSTFMNRNTYATYAGMGIVIAAAMTFATLDIGGRRGSFWRMQAAILSALFRGPGLTLLLCLAVGLLALLMTGSRAGIVSTVAGLAALMAVLLLRGNFRRSALVVGLVGALAVLAFGLGSDLLLTRLEANSVWDEGRAAIYRITLTAIADSPWLGMGYGTFAQVFPLYRDTSILYYWSVDKAHNTYLELVLGLGVPATALWLSGIGALWGRCFWAAIRRSRDFVAPLAATAVTALVAIHSLFDFSLQIQAVAITWAAILGAGVAQGWRRQDRRAR